MPESMQHQREMLVALRRAAEQRATAETDAMMRLEKEKAACQSSRSESRKKADENLGEAQQAMERARVVLAHAGLQKAFVKSVHGRPTIGSDDHAVQELADAVALANRTYQNLHENANRLRSHRLLWARRSCDKERLYPQQPIQGFGRIWCDYSEVKHGLGWDMDRMRDQDRESPGASVYRLQKFTGGFVFRDSDGWTHNLAYVFFNSGEFVRDSYTSP